MKKDSEDLTLTPAPGEDGYVLLLECGVSQSYYCRVHFISGLFSYHTLSVSPYHLSLVS